MVGKIKSNYRIPNQNIRTIKHDKFNLISILLVIVKRKLPPSTENWPTITTTTLAATITPAVTTIEKRTFYVQINYKFLH